MIKATLISESGEIRSGNEELLEEWRRYANEILWVDIEAESTERVVEILQSFEAHPLAIDDTLRPRHPPKIEFFDRQLFILYRGIKEQDQDLGFEHQQIAMFIENKLLVTVHTSNSIGINKAMKDLECLKLKTPFNIALQIMKNSSQIYLESLLDFDGHLGELEDKLQNGGNDQVLSELTSFKSKLIKLIRTFKYHLSISQALLNETNAYEFIDTESHIHTLTDLNDRFDRLATLSQMHYDICGDLIDGYLSISAHQLNVTMRVLTVITAIFVPLSFLAGLYGMNFDYIPELKHPYGYFYLLTGMSLLTLGLVALFKKKNWL